LIDNIVHKSSLLIADFASVLSGKLKEVILPGLTPNCGMSVGEGKMIVGSGDDLSSV